MADFKTRLKDLIDAAYPILMIETHEEDRILQDIRQVVQTRMKKDSPRAPRDGDLAPYYEWDAVDGMYRLGYQTKEGKLRFVRVEKVKETEKDPLLMLRTVKTLEASTVVLHDIHPFLEVPMVWRSLKNLIPRLKEVGVTIVMVCSRMKVPPELSKDIQLVEYSFPTRQELHNAFKVYVQETIQPDYKDVKLDDEFCASIAEASMGMTYSEAENSFALATVGSGRRNNGTVKLDDQMIRDIFENKILNLKHSALEYVPTRAGFDSVGGLDIVKAWALRRRLGFSDRARELNLPYPKGVLLAGIKGCGKTTTAMAIAHQFGFPLFKFDVSKLFASKVGESEANTREVIKVIESLGRCVLLLDEMEKFFGQHATSGSGDSGTSSRMFGTLVSWMSLKMCPAFIVGTLNNFEVLPSELIRKGRFDEVFWCDLPSGAERFAIFEVLLKTKFKVAHADAKLKDVKDQLIERTQEFSGAEIEAVIEEALYSLIEKPNLDLGDQLLSAASNITPQARVDSVQVATLRDKAKAFKRASSAIDPQAVTNASRKRAVKAS